MIETIMREKEGVFTGETTARCDECCVGIRWKSTKAMRLIRGYAAKHILRKEKGWKIGKRHLCPDCSKKP